ncbi:hypothetical protein RB195_014285 [Necator americanus]|uniref:Uncharacterized protein n=1 Tax=Necator americanus TaxID=51031 RepID=A0ABR1DZH1_NECAM
MEVTALLLVIYSTKPVRVEQEMSERENYEILHMKERRASCNVVGQAMKSIEEIRDKNGLAVRQQLQQRFANHDRWSATEGRWRK